MNAELDQITIPSSYFSSSFTSMLECFQNHIIWVIVVLIYGKRPSLFPSNTMGESQLDSEYDLISSCPASRGPGEN